MHIILDTYHLIKYKNKMMLFYRTGCETVEKVIIDGTKIKIERDYIDGCIFKSIVSQSYLEIKAKTNLRNVVFVIK